MPLKNLSLILQFFLWCFKLLETATRIYILNIISYILLEFQIAGPQTLHVDGGYFSTLDYFIWFYLLLSYSTGHTHIHTHVYSKYIYRTYSSKLMTKIIMRIKIQTSGSYFHYLSKSNPSLNDQCSSNKVVHFQLDCDLMRTAKSRSWWLKRGAFRQIHKCSPRFFGPQLEEKTQTDKIPSGFVSCWFHHSSLWTSTDCHLQSSKFPNVDLLLSEPSA